MKTLCRKHKSQRYLLQPWTQYFEPLIWFRFKKKKEKEPYPSRSISSQTKKLETPLIREWTKEMGAARCCTRTTGISDPRTWLRWGKQILFQCHVGFGWSFIGTKSSPHISVQYWEHKILTDIFQNHKGSFFYSEFQFG